jgi:CheY-like chemotaxis protein
VSYPRKLHVLVVEDDAIVIEAYQATFGMLARKFDFAEIVWARSFAEATDLIAGNGIFHLVILDLNLPLEKRTDPVGGLSLGQQLLEALSKRDTYPVPSVLVISGQLNQPHSLGVTSDILSKEFAHGKLLIKGSDEVMAQIEEALSRALEYVDLGIHVRDAGKEWFPTLSPREDDLLRRCILQQPPAIGVDVRWWSAERGPSLGMPTSGSGQTKVLMGQYLLDDGMERSIPTFFKFENALNAPYVARGASILSQKLGHVTIQGVFASRQRSLLVTRSVTNRGVPISLTEYLHGPSDIVASNVPKLLSHVAAQLDQLGSLRDDSCRIEDLLWKHLDHSAIERILKRHESAVPDGRGRSPIDVWDLIQASEIKHWVGRRTCVHGDLNATNIAIDATDRDLPQAYIFDAGNTASDCEFRDLANIEVTSILFNAIGDDEDLVARCQEFYGNEFLPHNVSTKDASTFARNVQTLISSLRMRVTSQQERAIYAVCVFDAAMRQLSGIAFQSSPNKVKNPVHACRLTEWAGRWLVSVAPEIFPFLPLFEEGRIPTS